MKLKLTVLALVAMSGGMLISSSPFAAAAQPDHPVLGSLPASNALALAEFRKQADALYRMKERAFAAHDADTIVDRFYTKDAITVGGPDPKPALGREAFRAIYKTVVEEASSVTIDPFETHVGTDTAWEWANFKFILKDPKEKPITLTIVFLWAKDGSRWVCGGDAFAKGEFTHLGGEHPR